jgi:hypothetical protein
MAIADMPLDFVPHALPQANHYRGLPNITLTIHFGVDCLNREKSQIEGIKNPLLTSDEIFGKQKTALEKV